MRACVRPDENFTGPIRAPCVHRAVRIRLGSVASVIFLSGFMISILSKSRHLSRPFGIDEN